MSESTLHIVVGFSGAVLPVEEFELFDGATLSQTYLHFFTPHLAAIKEAPPGQPNPAPWTAVSDGAAADIRIQLLLQNDAPSSALLLAWRIVALLRLRTGLDLFSPVWGTIPFNQFDRGHNGRLFPLEVRGEYPPSDVALSIEDLRWVGAHLGSTTRLLEKSKFRNFLLLADTAATTQSEVERVVAAWAGIEALVGTVQETSRSVAMRIAALVSPPGSERQMTYTRMMSLYNTRSRIVHGDISASAADANAALRVARDVGVAIIELGTLPTGKELDRHIFV